MADETPGRRPPSPSKEVIMRTMSHSGGSSDEEDNNNNKGSNTSRSSHSTPATIKKNWATELQRAVRSEDASASAAIADSDEDSDEGSIRQPPTPCHHREQKAPEEGTYLEVLRRHPTASSSSTVATTSRASTETLYTPAAAQHALERKAKEDEQHAAGGPAQAIANLRAHGVDAWQFD
ncbi:hypothetical protein B0T17DRAFT_619654 [Bombardia bombarda]|uniref:Uncharacterized protein n=1 Tax=Bombardia bombarda TaxID=252184 RepID=A0AA39WIL5_9PEZI|nr:hypothetical protein B0T17DRAFT_619654 [Bombardia bombarda]